MVRTLVLLVCATACSTPAKKQDPPFVPPDDEAGSVAWQAANPPPDAAPPVFTFDWDKARRFTDKVKHSQPGDLPCDFRIKGPRPKGIECLPGKGGVYLAALMIDKVAIDDQTSQMVLDVGVNVGLTTDWYGAVIDHAGHLVDPWRKLDNVQGGRSWLTVPRPDFKTRSTDRIALTSELPK